MRKTLGTIAIIVILLIGFFGVRINDYQIEPFIKNWLVKNVEKVDTKTVTKQATKAATDTIIAKITQE